MWDGQGKRDEQRLPSSAAAGWQRLQGQLGRRGFTSREHGLPTANPQRQAPARHAANDGIIQVHGPVGGRQHQHAVAGLGAQAVPVRHELYVRQLGAVGLTTGSSLRHEAGTSSGVTPKKGYVQCKAEHLMQAAPTSFFILRSASCSLELWPRLLAGGGGHHG